MGRKRQRHQQAKAETKGEGATEHSGPKKGQPWNSTPADLPVRLLALHPQGPSFAVAFAFGKQLAVTADGVKVDLGERAQHGNTIRALVFDPTGDWLLTADDTKTVRLWRTADWTIAHTFQVPKKPSAGVFSLDSEHALVADKFGDVTAAATDGGQPAQLLGHYCSAITAMAVSPKGGPRTCKVSGKEYPAGCFVATADRDGRIRISLMPAEPLKGAHEIHSYCLGHTDFVTTLAFMTIKGSAGASVLISGSGDGTIRWWDHLRGRQEYCVQVTHPPEGKATAEAPAGDAPLPAAAAAANGDSSPRSADADGSGSGSGSVGGAASAAAEALGTEAVNGNAAAAAAGEAKSAFPAIIALAVSPRNQLLAVAVEGQDVVQLFHMKWWLDEDCTCPVGALMQLEPVTAPQVHLPSGLVFDGEDRLWITGGPLEGAGAGEVQVAVLHPAALDLGSQVRRRYYHGAKQVVFGKFPADRSFEDCTQKALSPAMRDAAAAVALSEDEVDANAAILGSGPGGQLGHHLKKRHFSEEELEARKRNRSDVRLKAATVAGRDLKAAAAAEEAAQKDA